MRYASAVAPLARGRGLVVATAVVLGFLVFPAAALAVTHVSVSTDGKQLKITADAKDAQNISVSETKDAAGKPQIVIFTDKGDFDVALPCQIMRAPNVPVPFVVCPKGAIAGY